MEHSFDTKIAKKTGIVPAIIFKNICFWVDKNKANNKHFYNGKYWTYNSIKAFSELFEYLTIKQIRSAILILEKEQYITTGNFNENKTDRTKWYSINDNYVYGNCICQKDKKNFPEMENGFAQEGKCIYTDSKHTDDKLTNSKHIIKEEIVKNSIFEQVLQRFNNLCPSLPKVLNLSAARKQKIKSRMNEMDNDISKLEKVFSMVERSEFLKGNNSRGWKANFDWIFANGDNWIKVLEGNYNQNETEDKKPKKSLNPADYGITPEDNQW